MKYRFMYICTGIRIWENTRLKIHSKWDRKADLGILPDFENGNYRVLINNKIVVATDVAIIEEATFCIRLHSKYSERSNEIRINQNESQNDNEINRDNDQDTERLPSEIRKPTKLKDDNVYK